MDEKTQERIITLRNRVFRNKTKINHHKIYILMAIACLLGVALFNAELVRNYFWFIVILFSLLIVSDIIAIAYHKMWIKKWRKELTNITGKDYDKLDSDTEEYISEADFKTFRKKYIKDADIILIHNSVCDYEHTNLVQKAYLGCLNAVLRSYCETNGILNSLKIQQLPYIIDFCKKELKHIEK